MERIEPKGALQQHSPLNAAGRREQVAFEKTIPVLDGDGRRSSIDAWQRGRLRDLLRINLRTARAYLLKEDFYHFWDYVSPTWAGKFLDQWCAIVQSSGIAPMKAKAKMLRAHRDLILNYFRAKKQFSSGVVEGLNTKVKLVTRRAFGHRKLDTIKIALFHALGRLPEPEHTHRFA